MLKTRAGSFQVQLARRQEVTTGNATSNRGSLELSTRVSDSGSNLGGEQVKSHTVAGIPSATPESPCLPGAALLEGSLMDGRK